MKATPRLYAIVKHRSSSSCLTLTRSRPLCSSNGLRIGSRIFATSGEGTLPLGTHLISLGLNEPKRPRG